MKACLCQSTEIAKLSLAPALCSLHVPGLFSLAWQLQLRSHHIITLLLLLTGPGTYRKPASCTPKVVGWVLGWSKNPEDNRSHQWGPPARSLLLHYTMLVHPSQYLNKIEKRHEEQRIPLLSKRTGSWFPCTQTENTHASCKSWFPWKLQIKHNVD